MTSEERNLIIVLSAGIGLILGLLILPILDYFAGYDHLPYELLDELCKQAGNNESLTYVDWTRGTHNQPDFVVHCQSKEYINQKKAVVDINK